MLLLEFRLEKNKSLLSLIRFVLSINQIKIKSCKQEIFKVFEISPDILKYFLSYRFKLPSETKLFKYFKQNNC